MALNENFFSSEEDVSNEPFFNTVTYTGNSVGRQITGYGFDPDFVWIKKRSTASNGDHMLFDVVRGADRVILSNSTQAQYDGGGSGYQPAFVTDGFSVTGNGFVNNGGNTFAAWGWKAGGTAVSNTDGTITSQVSANTASGFSIVKWTANGSTNNQLGHGLSSAPEIIIYKTLDTSSDWWTLTTAIDGSIDYLRLNSNAPKGDQSGITISSTTIPNWNFSGTNMIAYCFHSVYGVSKVGNYIGTGTNTTVDVGFEPQFVMIKNTTNNASWHIFDNKRTTSNPSTEAIFPNEVAAAADYNTVFEFTSNGFNNKVTSTSLNKPGSNYIYYAVAEPGTVTAVLTFAVDFLMVAGGGGGGSSYGASGSGGGAGEYLTSIGGTSLELEPDTLYNVTVGAGGAGGAGGGNNNGVNGSNSSFISQLTRGGGAGQKSNSNSNPGIDGGSGGGAVTQNLTGGASTAVSPGLGNAGGSTGPYGTVYPSGGGGGAGSAGGYASGTTGGGAGGDGVSNDITGTSTFYAAGGGGGLFGTSGYTNVGIGGSGIGGSSSITSDASGGAANTGSGGGGGSYANSTSPYISYGGGAGADGVVILRYPSEYTLSIPVTLTYTNLPDVGNLKVTKFTAGTGNIQFT